MLLHRSTVGATLLLLSAWSIPAQQFPSSQPQIWSARPDAASFERSENARLEAAQQFIAQLTAVQGARTLDNTLRKYDDAIREINTAANFAYLMQQVHPDAGFRDRATAMARQASAVGTALSLNRNVYDALRALDVSNADAATRYYVQHTLLEFRLAGVDQSQATRARLKQLNDQLTAEQLMFDRNISDSRNTIKVTDVHQLDGLPKDYIDRHKPAADGSITITTDDPDALPVLKFAKSAELRKRVYIARNTRAYPKNETVLKNMMRTRYEIAQLLGYKSWADYNAADKMIGSGSNIGAFIDQIDRTARPMADKELAMLLAEKRKFQPGATQIEDYEVPYLSELVRRSKFDFDSQSVRPYFPYARVEQGILDTAAALFHVRFRQEVGAPAWDPAVEIWDVLEKGQAIGRIYLDMHPRKGKHGHGETAPILDGIRGRQLPEAALILNLPQPTATDPGLMEYSDVVKFFHEFGHAMHHILGGQGQWAGIGGFTTEWDFIEAPSQMLEEWMRSPQVLASFARHYQTGQPIPADLVTRMDRALAFGRGAWVSQQNAFSAVSYDVYKTNPEAIDLDQLFQADMERFGHVQMLPGTHRYASFTHLGGYSSAYYTYLWDKVIAEDFFQQFDSNNLLTGDTGMRYRREVLEPGGSMPANKLVKNFLGRPQSIDALVRWMGEEFQ